MTAKGGHAITALIICPLLFLAVHGCGRQHPAGITNSLGMELVLIPAGEFRMGSSRQDLQRMMADFKQATGREYQRKWAIHLRDEMPPHRVKISRPFYLQAREVTNDQFAAFVKATGHVTTAEEQGGGWTFSGDKWLPMPGADWRHPAGPASSIDGKGDHPVVQVSWVDAMAFIRWLGEKEARPYALPGEAQWEYACRGRLSGALYPWGTGLRPEPKAANMPDEAYARAAGADHHHIRGYDDGYADTAPAGSFAANGFGLHDMIGNVWEWCADWYRSDYYAGSPPQDPPGPAQGTHRVLRGGGFRYLPSNMRCADRFRNRPRFRCPFAGFRVMMRTPDD